MQQEELAIGANHKQDKKPANHTNQTAPNHQVQTLFRKISDQPNVALSSSSSAIINKQNRTQTQTSSL